MVVLTILKHMSSSMGRMTSHILWKKKNHVPNHQPVIIIKKIVILPTDTLCCPSPEYASGPTIISLLHRMQPMWDSPNFNRPQVTMWQSFRNPNNSTQLTSAMARRNGGGFFVETIESQLQTRHCRFHLHIDI